MPKLRTASLGSVEICHSPTAQAAGAARSERRASVVDTVPRGVCVFVCLIVCVWSLQFPEEGVCA
jgi:hypothetical protein